jgi:hypothetical protein
MSLSYTTPSKHTRTRDGVRASGAGRGASVHAAASVKGAHQDLRAVGGLHQAQALHDGLDVGLAAEVLQNERGERAVLHAGRRGGRARGPTWERGFNRDSKFMRGFKTGP